MRSLVGIDRNGCYRPALNLLARLNFENNVPVLAHVSPSVVGALAGSPLLYDPSAADVQASLATAGHALLHVAQDQANHGGLGENLEIEYAVGNSSPALMDMANRRRSDLVAIGSTCQGVVGSFFLGSVGRALAIGGEQSFLVARGEPRTAGPVKAVFATDLSEYSDRCFARLLDMNPQGLGHLSIVTATESHVDPEVLGESITEAEEAMRRRGARMVHRLAAKGIAADYRLVEGHPAEAIRRVIQETDSELLILGARGHGIVERILIGSFALHAVVAEQYSVLVLRIPEA
jgi:nucleotide-binding universal stress UspA family protein